MARKALETGQQFHRDDILWIRDYWDSHVEAGWFPYQIARSLCQGEGTRYPWASQQTIIRIGRRETWKEVGVGATERPNTLARLAPLPPIPDLSPEALAEAIDKVPMPNMKADGTLALSEEPEGETDIMDLLNRRGKE